LSSSDFSKSSFIAGSDGFFIGVALISIDHLGAAIVADSLQ
jgi:hypothetical protein